jgi:hypothetical protein
MSLENNCHSAPSKLGRYVSHFVTPCGCARLTLIRLWRANIGGKWSSLGFGAIDKESSFKLLDTYLDLGVCQI